MQPNWRCLIMPLAPNAEIGCNQKCTDDLAPEGGCLTYREVCLVCNRAELLALSRNAMDRRRQNCPEREISLRHLLLPVHTSRMCTFLGTP